MIKEYHIVYEKKQKWVAQKSFKCHMTRLNQKLALKEQLLLDKRTVYGSRTTLVKCNHPTFTHKCSYPFILRIIHLHTYPYT